MARREVNTDRPEHQELWVVYGGRKSRLAGRFRSEGYFGIDFDLDNTNLLDADSDQDVDDLNPSVRRFLYDMMIDDHVLMPDQDRELIHYGTVASEPYFSNDGTYRHRRDIDWKRIIDREDIGLKGGYDSTVNRVRGELIGRFNDWLKENDVETEYSAEDSWVPFHLEVGRKLVEGEWWREEKRDQFAQMIDDIRNADPDENVSSQYERWSPDPFSFYLSFNMRTVGEMRLSAYRKVKELLNIDADVPDADHEASGLGVGWGWDPPIDDAELSFLWEFFRLAMEYGPVNSSMEVEDQFIAMYDRAASATFLRGMRGRVLSYWLYWIDPTKYLLTRRLRRQELGLIADLSADLRLSEELAQGIEYVKALGGVRGLGLAHNFTVLDVNRLSTTREMLGLDAIDPGTFEPYGIDDVLAEGVFLELGELERMMRILESKKNLILQGPPGVGKTFIARKLGYVLMGERGEDAEKRISSVQFHQSYSYEDFVGGFRPAIGANDQMVFTRQDGPFLKMCAEASREENRDKNYVMLIDEINRGNLSRVFGELLMLIEADKRKSEFGVSLQHRQDDDERFFVPENVYIIGTMNLADRSLTGMNVAMRRRFGFVDLKPQFGESVFTNWLSDETEMPPDMQARINAKMSALNAVISIDPSLDFNYAVGHSFFCPPQNEPVDDWDDWYERVVDYEIRPLLREYWFDDPERANDEADKLKKME